MHIYPYYVDCILQDGEIKRRQFDVSDGAETYCVCVKTAFDALSHCKVKRSNIYNTEVSAIITLKYGNTNTYFIKGEKGGLLVDTDYAGTLPAFYRAIKSAGIGSNEITYVLATHYHPDHMGLISELMRQNVRLLLIDTQVGSVHFSDDIFRKDHLRYTPIDETAAEVISCRDSRRFLSSVGIGGEIIGTPSHSRDSITLILDDGSCFAGDLEPFDYIDGYEENSALKRDWENLLSFDPETVFYAHRPKEHI